MVIGGIAALVIWFNHYKKQPKGRETIDQLKLRAPIFGPLTLKVATGRFARNFGTMLQSGIEVLTALGIVKNIIGNAILENAVENAINGVREGQDLAGELNKAGVFPRPLIHMIAIGERTGQLDSMLVRAAASYEAEVNTLVGALTSILEPLLIIFLAGVVGGILAAVLMPMLELSSLAGG